MFLEGGVAGAQPLHKGGPKARPPRIAVVSGQWLVEGGGLSAGSHGASVWYGRDLIMAWPWPDSCDLPGPMGRAILRPSTDHFFRVAADHSLPGEIAAAGSYPLYWMYVSRAAALCFRDVAVASPLSPVSTCAAVQRNNHCHAFHLRTVLATSPARRNGGSARPRLRDRTVLPQRRERTGSPRFDGDESGGPNLHQRSNVTKWQV